MTHTHAASTHVADMTRSPGETADGSGMQRQDRVRLFILIAMVVVGWYHTFGEMWLRWFPAWHTPGYTLTQRLGEGDSYYSHGPLVPAVSLLIASVIFQRVGLPTLRTRGGSIVGWLALAGSLLLHLVSVYARVTFVSGFALIGVIAAICLLAGGWVRIRAYWLPIVFLAFMVPLPMNWIADLNFQLKNAASAMALWLAVHGLGIPAVQDGSFVHLGGGRMLVIENVCGGLRSLISLVCFASLFALICRTRGWWRLFMLAMSVPVAVGCNVVRIVSLIVVAHRYGVKEAGPEGWFHNASGMLVFVLALATLFGMEKLIVMLAERLRRPWIDVQLLGFLKGLEAFRAAPRRSWSVPAMLAVSAGLSLFWSDPAVAQHRGEIARAAVDMRVTIDGKSFIGHDLELDRLTLTVLETNDYLYRRFSAEEGGESFDLLIVFSANNRKGTHPPEVCLAGSGEQIVSKDLLQIAPEGMSELSMRQLFTQHALRQSCYLYVYKCGGAYTPNFLAQQAQIFVNGLTARNSAGALIRFTVSSPQMDRARAERLIEAAAAELLPQIDRKIP